MGRLGFALVVLLFEPRLSVAKGEDLFPRAAACGSWQVTRLYLATNSGWQDDWSARPRALILPLYRSAWAMSEEGGWVLTKAFTGTTPPKHPTNKCFGRVPVAVRFMGGRIWADAWVYDTGRQRWVRATVVISGEQPSGELLSLLTLIGRPMALWPADSASKLIAAPPEDKMTET